MSTNSVDAKSVDTSTLPQVATSTSPEVNTDQAKIQRNEKCFHIRKCIVEAVNKFDNYSKLSAVDYLTHLFEAVDSDLLSEAMVSQMKNPDEDTLLIFIIEKYLHSPRSDLLQIIKLFIAKNACMNQPNNKGLTPFMLMMKLGTDNKTFFDFIATNSKIKDSDFFECLKNGNKNFKSFDYLLKLMQENYCFINKTEYVDDKSKMEKLVTENDEYKMRINHEYDSNVTYQSKIKQLFTENEAYKLRIDELTNSYNAELKLRKEVERSFKEHTESTTQNREQLRSSLIKRLQTDLASLNLKRNNLNLNSIVMEIPTNPTDEEISNLLINLYKHQIEFDKMAKASTTTIGISPL